GLFPVSPVPVCQMIPPWVNPPFSHTTLPDSEWRLPLRDDPAQVIFHQSLGHADPLNPLARNYRSFHKVLRACLKCWPQSDVPGRKLFPVFSARADTALTPCRNPPYSCKAFPSRPV